jgi:hydroxyacylglutathione hydrolase
VTAQDPIVRVANREFAANTYIYRTGTPGGCILIDPGLDRDAIEMALGAAGLTPMAIFVTHGHFDHIGSAEHFRREYGVDLHMHGLDAKVARSSNFMMMAFKMASRIEVPEVSTAIEDGFTWSHGVDHVEAIHVPGHTPGSTILNVNGRLFTGDTIYRDEVWLTALPEQNRPLLIESLRRIWDVLPDAADVYPGHGGTATLGQIKRTNVPLRKMLGLVGSTAND